MRVMTFTDGTRPEAIFNDVFTFGMTNVRDINAYVFAENE